MAVKPELIKSRLRALFPKANLSTKRLDEISARLAKKPADDADEAAIDEVINDYNDNGAMSFEEIAKSDDKIRTLEAGKPTPPKTDEPIIQPINPETDPIKIMMATLTNLSAEIKGLKEEKTKETVVSKFANDERVKNIPDFIRKGYTPSSDEDYEVKVNELVEAYKPFAEKNKLAGFDGSDNPISSTGGEEAKGKVKPISIEDARKIVS